MYLFSNSYTTSWNDAIFCCYSKSPAIQASYKAAVGFLNPLKRGCICAQAARLPALRGNRIRELLALHRLEPLVRLRDRC